MISIEQYILRSKEERQFHLDLNTPCDERGGFSSYFKGLLAYHCGTSIPDGHLAHVCHACHNARCSNVKHLYWGTPSENRIDAVSAGAKSIWECMVERHGEEEAKRRQYRGKSHMSKMGQISASRPKDPARYRKTSESLKGRRKATDGITTITLQLNEELPEGYYFGMAPRKRLQS